MIEIVEKPEWVSWDDIHDVVWKAHENNRKKGVIMSYPSLPGEKNKGKSRKGWQDVYSS